ncbi:molybdenum cofactor sulfurase isoform X1 [Iris pallida]|uniref:Molybdenum cofactor sulfurase isoform X1 n=1 Tax=Iris pallida TaxID=29817 RepID=A0AAX6HQG5_IRIPA|nr:molybdenum cofactor sulfurase isoform X1 [Iris pallida]
MCYIHTSVDLGMGKLFLESPHSTTTLQICLQKNLSCRKKWRFMVKVVHFLLHTS